MSRLATEKQKTAIKNLVSYIRTGTKTDWSCLEKKDIDLIEGATLNQASIWIDNLIERKNEKEKEDGLKIVDYEYQNWMRK